MKSMKVGLVLVAMLLGSSVAFWKVPLSKSEVKKTVDSVDFVSEEVHIGNIVLGKGDNSKHVKATFDSTILFNWYLDSETKILKSDNTASSIRNNYYVCKPPCQFDVVNGEFQTFKTDHNQNSPILYINGDRLKFNADTTTNVIGRNSTNKIEFNQKEFDNTHFLVPNVIAEDDQKLTFQESEVMSLGLGRPDYVVLKQNNFADALNKTVKIPSIGFSLYIHDTLSQIIFGEAENFFAKTRPLTRIRNLDRSRLWTSRLIKMVVNKKFVVGSDSPRQCTETNYDVTPAAPATYTFPTSLDCDITVGRANPTVVFDTTTRYIYGPAGQLRSLFNQIQLADSENVIVASTSAPGNYEAVCKQDTYKHKFPHIDIYFYEHPDKAFTLLPEDYIRYDANKPGDKKCWLLFKNNEATIDNDPKKKFNWYLGTAFFANNYCHFDQRDNAISCAPAFRFTPGEKHIGGNSRVAALVAGALILLASLGLLVSLFTKVPPFQPSSQPVPSQNNRSANLGRTQIETHTPTPLPLYQSNTNNIYNSRVPAANSYYQR